MPNRVNRRLSRDVANGEHIEGSLADCISGRLHLPSHRAQRVRRASRLVRDYTLGCDSFIRSVPSLVLEQVRARGLPPRPYCQPAFKARAKDSLPTVSFHTCVGSSLYLRPCLATAFAIHSAIEAGIITF